MNLQTIHIYDERTKKSWGNGKWLSEPDLVAWIDEKTMLPCMIYRNSLGALCGYVGVREESCLYEEDMYSQVFSEISAHGGLTFTGTLDKATVSEFVGTWWIGFDCAHAGDFVPGFPRAFREFGGDVSESNYRDIHYVSEQVRALSEQISKLSANATPLNKVKKIIKKIANKE